jgi:glycosyltransferase involved in cell wall biosynthesis
VIHAGEVRDVLPYLHAADLALCPLRTGSGTSLKTIEYLAAGLPLVTTAFGVRGLDVVPGVEAEVCDLQDMPARSGALAADPARRALLARGARLAAERFSWQEIGAEATRALDEVVAGRRAAR